MRKALVLGAGGFIGSHLVKQLKYDGFWVRGVDLKHPEWSETEADDFVIGDLLDPSFCFNVMSGKLDDVYQLAADFGGMGYLESAECEIMRNNALININALYAAMRVGVARYFFSSSVCVYPDMRLGDEALSEEEVYPALPDNEYGWEKLYAERIISTYSRHFQTKVRIGRFENCYGPEGTWRGGREKAPAAICRKVAEAEDGASIELWGDGKAVRNFTYVDDMVDGILKLMNSSWSIPTNIGTSEYITVDTLANMIIEISGKKITKEYVAGPVGVESRNFSKKRILSLGWKAKISLPKGLRETYSWILSQVRKETGYPYLPSIEKIPPKKETL